MHNVVKRRLINLKTHIKNKLRLRAHHAFFIHSATKHTTQEHNNFIIFDNCHRRETAATRNRRLH